MLSDVQSLAKVEGVNKIPLNTNERTRVLACGWRDFDPSDYPAALLDPRNCAKDLLRNIYARIRTSPSVINLTVRNAEIYHRHKLGETTAELAQVYGLKPTAHSQDYPSHCKPKMIIIDCDQIVLKLSVCDGP
jgi:hypothetical protein